jgi:hypothetical protein
MMVVPPPDPDPPRRGTACPTTGCPSRRRLPVASPPDVSRVLSPPLTAVPVGAGREPPFPGDPPEREPESPRGTAVPTRSPPPDRW